MCLSSVTPNKKHQLNPQRFVSNETCILSGSKNRSGNVHIDGWVQDCCNSIANALKLQQSCTKPSIIYPIKYAHCLVVNYFLLIMTLQWRHNGHDSISNHADQRKHQSSASLAFVRGIQRGPVNSPHKWPVTRKLFPFGDVFMNVCDLFRYIRQGCFIHKHWALIQYHDIVLPVWEIPLWRQDDHKIVLSP